MTRWSINLNRWKTSSAIETWVSFFLPLYDHQDSELEPLSISFRSRQRNWLWMPHDRSLQAKPTLIRSAPVWPSFLCTTITVSCNFVNVVSRRLAGWNPRANTVLCDSERYWRSNRSHSIFGFSSLATDYFAGAIYPRRIRAHSWEFMPWYQICRSLALEQFTFQTMEISFLHSSLCGHIPDCHGIS
jgi:hypothetical protein